MNTSQAVRRLLFRLLLWLPLLVLVLLVLAGLVVLGGTAAAPFIYPLF